TTATFRPMRRPATGLAVTRGLSGAAVAFAEGFCRRGMVAAPALGAWNRPAGGNRAAVPAGQPAVADRTGAACQFFALRRTRTGRRGAKADRTIGTLVVAPGPGASGFASRRVAGGVRGASAG